MELHIIYPKDDTTEFLQEIVEYLLENTVAEIVLHRLATVDDHANFFASAQMVIPTNATVLYMGHGTSGALSGASTAEYSYGAFISDNQLAVFKNRKVILLTCRSTEYLSNYGLDSGLKAGIGFPNLITEPYELYYAEDPETPEGVPDSDILIFRQLIVDILKYSLEDYINSNLSFFQLYKRVQLRSRRELVNFYNTRSDKGKLPLGQMLSSLEKGISFIGN